MDPQISGARKASWLRFDPVIARFELFRAKVKA
jgi:hypothetical protein